MYIHSSFLRACAWGLISLLILPASAYAATQGTLGATSTGSASISITKSMQAQISDLSDMTLASWSIGDGAVTLTTNACIYSSTGGYKITATGDGLAGIFTLASGAHLIPYSVTWNGGGAGGLANTGTTLLPTVQSTTFSNANTSSATCSGGGSGNDTARVIVGISNVAMIAATASATPYTGVLTLLVTPF